MRLIPTLRDAAKKRNPYEILARSAAAFFRAQNPTAGSVPQEDEELGNALADLAVTGRRTYCLLATPPLTPLHELQVLGTERSHIDLGTSPYTASELVAKVGGPARASGVGFSDAVGQCRQYRSRPRVHHRLGAPRPGGRTHRHPSRSRVGRGLGRRRHAAPTNQRAGAPLRAIRDSSDCARHGQPSGADAADPVPDRVTGGPRLCADPHTLRELPPDPEPEVPDGNNVILFLHGHVSGAEEALTLIPLLHLAGLARGTKFSVISVDLPNCGYSESFDHEKVASSSATQWPSGPIDREPIRTPVLDFVEDFVIAFVDALDQITPIKDRFSGVIGGSLGGNLGLRLGRRSPMPAWLDKGIVSWNAASVWDPMVNDHIKSQAPGKCMNNWEASEFDDSRRNYFHEVYDTVVIPVVLPVTQPQLWYRPGGSRVSVCTSPARGSRDARSTARTSGSGTGASPASSSSSAMSTGWIAGTATAPGAMSSTS